MLLLGEFNSVCVGREGLWDWLPFSICGGVLYGDGEQVALSRGRSK